MSNKPLIVQKYGGTSVGDIEKISAVAKNIAATRNLGYNILVVLSAMAGETNRLIALANSITNDIETRELDVIATTGEQVTVALLSLALKNIGIQAKSYCGWQIPIITSDNFTQARIKQVATDKISTELNQGIIIIVAGFQGISPHGDITTLGRGGSDTSAVALAVSLNAKECQIYTDVNGVYNADPNKVTAAKRLDVVDGLLMLEAASLGTQVLHVRSCELGYRYKTNIRVLSTFAPQDQGTLVMNQCDLENYPIISLSTQDSRVLVSFNYPGTLGKILQPIYNSLSIDMLQINKNHLAFIIEEADTKTLTELLKQFTISKLQMIHNITKISLIGSGFRSNKELNQKFWELLNDDEIFITSHNEISISIAVHQLNSATVRNKLTRMLDLNLTPKIDEKTAQL